MLARLRLVLLLRRLAAAFLPVVFLAFARPDAAFLVVARLRVAVLAVLLRVPFLAAAFLVVARLRVAVPFLAAAFLVVAFLRVDFFALEVPFGASGTFSPFSLASDKPIAMACLRLVTFLPLRPLRSVPFFSL